MLRIPLFILFALLANLLPAQSFSKLWNRVEDAQRSDLPRTAIDFVKTIEDKAVAEGNTPQEMMALFVKMRLQVQLSPDSFEVNREAITRRVQQFNDTTERAFWNAFLAKTLAESSLINYDERRKYAQLFVAQLADMELFHRVKDKDITPLIRKGKDAKEFRNDVLHVLLFDGLNKLPLSAKERLQLCQRAENFYRSKSLYAAAIRMALRVEDAELVAARYADRPENAIAYAAWVEQFYHQADLSDNKMRQQVVTLAHEGIEKYGKHPDAKRIKAVVKQLENPSVNLSAPHALCYPNLPMKLAIQANNLQKAKVEIHRCSADGDTLLQHVATLRVQFPKAERWRLQYDTLSLTLPHPGAYKLVLKASGDEATSSLLRCSRIMPYIFTPGNGTSRIMALDALTGKAFQEFSVVKLPTDNAPQRLWHATEGALWLRQQDLSDSTNDGETIISHWNEFQILLPGDACSKPFSLNLSNRPYHGNAQRHQQRAQLFIDRNLYRPGQTVHLAGILYSQQGDSLCVDADVALLVKLLKRGNKEVVTLQARTDQFGRFSGDFLLPADQQEGYFYFQVEPADTAMKAEKIPVEGTANFSIGAYKRPTFSVAFLPITTAYTWGDTLQVRGKAESMTLQPMANALVRYTITKPTPFRGTPNQPLEGVVHTNAQGEFTLSLVLKKQPQHSATWRHLYQNYSVSISVRGDNGETQTQQLYIPVHEKATTLDLSLPKIVVKEQLPQLLFHNTNSLAVKINEPVTVSLYNEGNSLVWIQKRPANAPFCPKDWNGLDDGTYRLEAQTPSGGRVKHEFLLIGETSKVLPVKSPSFFISQEWAVSKAEKAVLIGSAHAQVSLFKDIVSHKGEMLSSECIPLSEGVHRLSLAYDSLYQEGATVCLTALINGEFHQHTLQLERPQPDLRLNLSWKTFRNRLQPGQKEEWQLRVTRPDGSPASVSLIARLYDASLDALAHNRWYVAPYKAPYFVSPYGQVYYNSRLTLVYSPKLTANGGERVEYSSWNLLLNGAMLHEVMVGNPVLRKSFALKGQSNTSLRTFDAVTEETARAQGASDAPSAPQIPLREHFDEVAFMEAALETDADGTVDIRFTLPEQLTTWNFTAFAHDPHLRHALIDTTVVVQKAVTVTANVPRFVREGDRLTIPVVVRSLLADTTKGHFVATFFDADTRAELSRTTGVFTAEHGSASFLIHLPALTAESLAEKGLSMPQALGCQVGVEGRDFADGEAHRIPVLSDRVEVVRNLPFSITDGGAHTYHLDTLWTDTLALRAPQLTVNFTPSALYAAAQALASLSVAPVYGIDDWARRYYAVSLALFIHEKGVVFPDFDVAKAEILRDEAAMVLRQKQLKNGAWAWFDGMRESAFITNEILLLLARLESLTGNHPLRENASQALHFMHHQMEKLYQDMVAEERKAKCALPLGELPLRYLDACAYLKADTTAACQYFLSKAENMNANYSLYGKAVMSRVLRQNGKQQVADLLLQSVQEYIVETPEMGAYFDAPKAQMTYHSYRIPTQTAVIEAFHAVGNTNLVRRLQQWLLQSRRTQQWETSRATADAVFALCLSENDTTKILHPNGVILAPTEATFQGIYRSLTVETCDTVKGTRIHKCQETIGITAPKTTISSKILNLSYGSARAAYSLPISMVERYDSGLKITLHLEVKRNGKWVVVQENEPIDATLPLRQVARIVASRDFDFVCLNMPRPACTEPAIPLSGYAWQEGVGCYRVVTDHGADFYADKLPKGTYTIVEALHNDRSGTYEQGVATITCTYAPEFAGNTTGRKLQVGEVKE